MRPFSITEIPLWGRSMVDASAGTGKTFAIATLFVRLLLETDRHPSQLLVVTFTEAATAELRDRIRLRVREALSAAREPADAGAATDPMLREILARAGDPLRSAERLEQALYEFDNVEISTIHGFCQRMLVERAFLTSVAFRSELYGDARPVIDDLVLDYWATHAGPAQPELLAYLESNKFNLEAARRLCQTVQRTPEAVLLPELPERSTPPDFDRFRGEHARAREVWQRSDVVALVAASNARKQVYNRKNTPTWARDAARFMQADPGLFLTPPQNFSRFGSKRLSEAGASELADHELVRACDRLLEEHDLLRTALDVELLRFKLGLLQFVQEGLAERTRRTHQLSFDDLLRRMQQALRGKGGGELAASIRKRFPTALIDEFQDTDPLQLEIFERIYDAPNVSLFLIGDPKQAIYSFRGADVFSYVNAMQRTAPERRYGMTTNYRSDPSLLAAINHLFEGLSHPFLLPDIRYHPVAPRPGAEDALTDAAGRSASGLCVSFARTGESFLEGEWPLRQLPRIVALDIDKALRGELSCRGKALVPADIAVLTRTNDEAFLIQAALRERSIPSVVLGDKSVYASREARELEYVLNAALEPSNARLLRAAVTTELLGVTAAELWALDESDTDWERWHGIFHELAAVWAHTGFVHMCRALISRCRVQARLLEFLDGERRLTNLFQLIELLHAAASRAHLGPSGTLAFLKRERRRRIMGVEAEAAQIRLESDAAAVKITTMHKSKGLEYPVVYCPYLWRGTLLFGADQQVPKFHGSTGRLALDLGSREHAENLERASWEQFAENLRLAYVALTRARHRCTVYWGRLRQYSTSPLGYLLHPLPASDSPPSVAAIKEHLGALDDAALWAELESHAERVPIALELDGGRAPATPDAPLTVEFTRPLAARQPSRSIDDRFRVSSFSALTAQASPAAANEHARDHDLHVDAGAEAQKPVAPREALRLAEFPRGAKAGSFFHEVLEHHDFASARPGNLPKLVETRLGSYRFPVELWRDRVCEQVFALLDTELCPGGGGAPLRLGEVTPGERLNELEFCLPVGKKPTQGLAATGLARVFREHPSSALPEHYAERIAELGFVPLVGFLRGYIDLVFCKAGRYYLVDYKANHLGEYAADYGPDALKAAMVHGHYYLQYHFYALALHRHLGSRVRDYEFERHFGGVFYLFLKGMGPELGSSGIFFEKPPLGRLNALSRLLEQGQ